MKTPDDKAKKAIAQMTAEIEAVTKAMAQMAEITRHVVLRFQLAFDPEFMATRPRVLFSYN